MQPTYLPWLGYFDLIEKADVFVFLNHVQFSKQSWQQRNKIRDKNGELILTIPIKHGNHKDTLIKDVLIDTTKKPLIKHLKSIEMNYRKAKNFPVVMEELQKIYLDDYETLQELNIDLIKLGCKLQNISSEFVLSSDLDVQGQKVDALIDICKKLEATHYLSPVGSKDYIDENNIFAANNISLEYQNYKHPVYQQRDFDNFISHLSFIDYLFNI
jgi:hypothetical protein